MKGHKVFTPLYFFLSVIFWHAYVVLMFQRASLGVVPYTQCCLTGLSFILESWAAARGMEFEGQYDMGQAAHGVGVDDRGRYLAMC